MLSVLCMCLVWGGQVPNHILGARPEHPVIVIVLVGDVFRHARPFHVLLYVPVSAAVGSGVMKRAEGTVEPSE